VYENSSSLMPEIHNINTRNKLDLHYPQSHLSVYQKGAHYTGIKVFNRLLVPIKQLSHDTKQFKMDLKRNIQEETANRPINMLERVMRNSRIRFNRCIDNGGVSLTRYDF
jgi:hypothetical protein